MPLKGRPPTPTRILEMKGSYQKHPERKRARKDEPQTGKCFASPPPEKFLIPEPEMGYQQAARHLKEWNQLALEGPDIGYSSRGTVISLCILKADIWQATPGSRQRAALIKLEDTLRSSLGLTEVSRPKVNAGNNANNARGSGLAALAQDARGSRRA